MPYGLDMLKLDRGTMIRVDTSDNPRPAASTISSRVTISWGRERIKHLLLFVKIDETSAFFSILIGCLTCASKVWFCYLAMAILLLNIPQLLSSYCLALFNTKKKFNGIKIQSIYPLHHFKVFLMAILHGHLKMTKLHICMICCLSHLGDCKTVWQDLKVIWLLYEITNCILTLKWFFT